MAVRGGGGSCFERFHSSMVPDYPFFCYRTKPPSAFHPFSFNPAVVLVLRHLHHLLSAAIRVRVTRRHRPSIFLFDRFFPDGRADATDASAAVALCMCSVACIRCESWTKLFGCTVLQKDRALTWMHFQPGCFCFCRCRCRCWPLQRRGRVPEGCLCQTRSPPCRSLCFKRIL